MKKLPTYLIAWLLYVIFTLPLTLLGVPLVAIYARLPHARVRRLSKKYPDGRSIVAWSLPWFDAVWGNEEDGIDGLPLTSLTASAGAVQPRQQWWADKTKDWSMWSRIFVWSAIRNSTANLRFSRLFGLVIDPQLVKFSVWFRKDGTRRSWVAAQGYKAGFRWNWTDKRYLWIGWKVKPEDAALPGHALPVTDSRAPGVGFAFQIYGGG